MAKRGQGEGSISKRPDGTWWARITVGRTPDGKQKRKAFYGKTRKEVQEKLTAALNELNQGIYIEPSKMPVLDWMRVWVEEYKKNSVRKSTYEKYKREIIPLEPYLDNFTLESLRDDIIQKVINQMHEDGYKARTIQTYMCPLKYALQQAADNGLISKNPAAKMTLPKDEKEPERILSVKEQKLLEDAAKQEYYGEIFILILYTGLRIGEALALTWDDIDFEKKVLSVNKTLQEITTVKGKRYYKERGIGLPKSKSGIRKIPLVSSIITLLTEMKAHQDKLKGYGEPVSNLVFQNGKGGYFWSCHVRKKLKSICDSLGIEGIHPHSLRHTFASRCLENGIDMKITQELLGHSSIQMTADIYTHVLPETKTKAMTKLENLTNL